VICYLIAVHSGIAGSRVHSLALLSDRLCDYYYCCRVRSGVQARHAPMGILEAPHGNLREVQLLVAAELLKVHVALVELRVHEVGGEGRESEGLRHLDL
jgi:hypothetical protein